MPDVYRFTVPQVMGAVRTTQRAKYVDDRYQRYEAYKSVVRAIANTALVPATLEKNQSAAVEVYVYWKKKARCDIDNAIKSVLDSLWKNDRRVLSVHGETFEDTDKEEYISVRVQIS